MITAQKMKHGGRIREMLWVNGKCAFNAGHSVIFVRIVSTRRKRDPTGSGRTEISFSAVIVTLMTISHRNVARSTAKSWERIQLELVARRFPAPCATPSITSPTLMEPPLQRCLPVTIAESSVIAPRIVTKSKTAAIATDYLVALRVIMEAPSAGVFFQMRLATLPVFIVAPIITLRIPVPISTVECAG